MDDGVDGVIEESLQVPFRILKDGDGTAANPGSRIKSRFILIPTFDFESNLDDIIMKNGGDVLGDFSSEADVEYAVTLLDERYYLKNSTKNCYLPPDTFSSVFVGDAIICSRKSLPLPDLNKYRLTTSKYSSYDANKILFQQIKWSDLVPLAQPPSYKVTAREVIAKYKTANPLLRAHYQDMRRSEKKAKNEKNLPVEKAHVSEIVQPKQKSTGREEQKRSSAGKIFEDDELDSNNTNTTKSPTSASVPLKQKPDIRKSADDSTSRLDSKSPESIQPNDKPSPCPVRIHRSQSLPSPGTGFEDDILANDSESPEELPDLPEPRVERTDQAVRQDQVNQTTTPRKRSSNLPIAEDEADGESSDSPESNDNRSNQPTPVKLAPNPVLGETPPRVKRPKLVQRVFTSPASPKSDSKQKSPSHSKADKSTDNATRGKHDGWLSEDEDSLSGNENNGNDSSDYSLSEGESNMFKRPKLVPKAFAGPPSAKSKKKSVEKVQKVPRSANSIAKAQIGFDNDDGFISTDASCNDMDDDNVSVTSSASTTNLRKGPKLTFSRKEGQKMLILVCEKKAFMYTKGNRWWQQVEETGLFPGRTHQSLKEHWRKKVLPNALTNKLYEITPEQLSQLKKAQNRMKWSQHANFCPDFTF